MPELVILEGEKLQQLTKMIHIQEVEAIYNIKFSSEVELAKYLRICNENYDLILKLLNDGNETKERFKTDETRYTIAGDINSYLVTSVNVGLQVVKNYTLRSSYLTKIKDHAEYMFKALEDLDLEHTKNVINVPSLANEAFQYKNFMLEYTRKYQSTASQNYSKALMENGIKFQNLVKSHQTKLGFSGPFKDLTDEQKLLVYGDVIEESGRGNFDMKNIFGKAGTAVSIFLNAKMVWEIFSSEHVFKEATRDAMTKAAGTIGGGLVGDVVEAALPSLTGIEATTTFVIVAGTVGEFVGAFLIGAFVGWIFDSIFSSGDSSTLSTDGLRCYVAPLPDGEILARQIAIEDQTTN